MDQMRILYIEQNFEVLADLVLDAGDQVLDSFIDHLCDSLVKGILNKTHQMFRNSVLHCLIDFILPLPVSPLGFLFKSLGLVFKSLPLATFLGLLLDFIVQVFGDLNWNQLFS